MKRISKSSKKKTNNKINNKTNKRKRSFYYHTGGREIPPKWKQSGYKTEADYLEHLEQQRQQREREVAMARTREREIQKVLNNPIIQSIIIVIMNPDQAAVFEAYIRENIRITNNRESFNQMIEGFINEAFQIMDNEQGLLLNRIMDAIQEERMRIVQVGSNQPFRPLDIVSIIERVVRENNDQVDRNGGNGKKQYYKRFTRKNKSNRRK